MRTVPTLTYLKTFSGLDRTLLVFDHVFVHKWMKRYRCGWRACRRRHHHHRRLSEDSVSMMAGK